MIVLHHLNYSRSTRVLWLLEELGLDYRLVKYERTPGFRAPPELAKVQPLGKAPVIQDDDLTLAESAVILDYIDNTYGEGRLAPPAGTKARALHEEWLQYVESTAGFPIMMTLIGGMTGGLPDGLAAFAKPAVARTLDYIAEGIGAGPYIMGEQFTLADIQFSYVLVMARHAGLLEGRQPILDYLDRLAARPAYARAIEIGGPMAPPKR